MSEKTQRQLQHVREFIQWHINHGDDYGEGCLFRGIPIEFFTRQELMFIVNVAYKKLGAPWWSWWMQHCLPQWLAWKIIRIFPICGVGMEWIGFYVPDFDNDDKLCAYRTRLEENDALIDRLA